VLARLRIVDAALRQDWGIDRPKIAVLGLNPHAGDGGVIGREEIDHILPAVKGALDEGILAFGPFPADGFFATGEYRAYDGVLAMYHDQGLAPFKALTFESGVNCTVGLPIVRTSPDHGTAYAIAGQNKARPGSMRAAMFLAAQIARRRRTAAAV
jgi:4-hydroxythreonine-4-phosphate dehydrogenase